MKNILFLAFCSLFLFSNCNQNNSEAFLKLTFKPKFGNEALQMSKMYACNGGDSMSLEALNFFVTGIELTRENGKKIQLLEDDGLYINFDNTLTLAQSQAGQSFTIPKVLEDGFSEIKFSIGVVGSINNNKMPANFPSSNALGDDGNYWTAWDSYIFSRVEGNLDTSRSSNMTIPLPFLYHAGANDMLQIRTFSKTFATINSQTTTLVFEVDAENIFYQSNNLLDIRSLNVSHTASPTSPAYPYAVKSLQNLATGISIQ
jgi:hypothetical protein